MRWDELRIAKADVEPGLFGRDEVYDRGRLVESPTPEFAGTSFFEIHAKSMINRVPAASQVPFQWTINPYRGCGHKCRYCFARNSHTYLGLDAGEDFDSKIVVKVNAAEVVQRELAAARWKGEPIAMGTNVDCYQRAEGRYRLMPGIIEALTARANPFSILTKGSLILRDLPLLQAAQEHTEVSTAVSVGFLDQDLWRLVEPGTPAPHKRLEVCAALTDTGIGCGVLMGPILPYLTDTPRQIDATVRAIAEAGARSVAAIPLHLRTGAREWFFSWLAEHRPELVGPYERLYRGGAYAPKAYQERISRQVREAAERHGLAGRRPSRELPLPQPMPETQQLTLLLRSRRVQRARVQSRPRHVQHDRVRSRSRRDEHARVQGKPLAHEGRPHPPVVGDDHQRAPVVGQRLFQLLHQQGSKMVRRLVEQNQIVRRRHEPGQLDPPPLTHRQLVQPLPQLGRGEQAEREQLLLVLLRQAQTPLRIRLEHRPRRPGKAVVLMQDPDPFRQPHRPLGRHELACQHRQQRALARTVRPGHQQPLPGRDRQLLDRQPPVDPH